MKVKISVVLLTMMVMLQSGCGAAKQVAGIGDFKVDVSGPNLTASLQLTKYQSNVEVTLPVPKLTNAFIGLGIDPNNSKGSLLHFITPLTSIANAVADGSMPVRGLPDGRPLYGTTERALPSFDFTLDKLNLRMYVSTDVFGLFIPLPLPAFGDPVTFPIKDPRGYVVAYAVAVSPASNGKGAGVIVLFPVATTVNLQ